MVSDLLLQALITIETVKYLREQVTACYRKEQTNHLEYCKPYVHPPCLSWWTRTRATVHLS